MHEFEQARDAALKQAELEQAEEQRVQEAVAAAQVCNMCLHIHCFLTTCKQHSHHRKTGDLLTFFRLHSALSNAHPSAINLGLNENEGLAVYSITETLLGEDYDSKVDVVKSFIAEEGEIQGVPC